MSRRLSILLIVCLLLGGLNAVERVSAQIAAWEVIVLTEPLAGTGGTFALVRVTPAGLDAPIPIPLDVIPYGAHITDVEVSPDLHYAVVALLSPDAMSVMPVRIVDLRTGSWIEFAAPDATPAAYDVSGFDPGGTRFALSYVYEDLSRDFPYIGSFGVVDAVTGEYVEESTRPEFVARVTNGGITGWYVLGDWEADGVRLHPNCYACEPAFEGEYSAWNPDTAAFLPATGDIFSIFGEQLAATGEIIARGYSESYPFSTEPMAYFAPSNVIAYLPSAASLPTQDDPVSVPASTVIYHDPLMIDISTATIEWVNDGNHVLINTGADVWTLLARAGGSQSLDISGSLTGVQGTPDGWIGMLPQGAGRFDVIHYRVVGDTVESVLLGRFTDEFTVIAAPDLGASASPVPASLTPVLPNFAQLEAVMLANQPVCAGFMPSRIWQGQLARVTPGAANNIRINPTTGAEAVGQIPGSATFRVLSGPICADRTAWWYLEYNGQYGYTAEGMGDTYFVELVRP